MAIDVGFAERLSHVVQLTNAFIAAGNETEDARSNAKQVEEEILGSAASLEEYQTRMRQAVEGILSSMPAPTLEEQPVEVDEVFNTDGPSFGAYQYATFHADGLMSTVFKAKAKDENAPVRVVALKHTRPAMMGPPHNSVREARILAKARHDSIVPLLDTIHDPGDHFILVFPFLRQDLENLLRSDRLDRRQASMVFDGLFSALEHIHSMGIIHRDVKPSNILLKTMDGPAYLIDFGIAWFPDDRDSEPATSKITDVGTTRYRAPEILFGDKAYDTSLDMWAAGCVVAELVKVGHLPIFDSGEVGSELALIKSIFTTLGTPSEETWPSAKDCPDWGKMRFQQFAAKTWEEIVPKASATALDFVSKTVCYEKTARLTAKDALKHELRSNLANAPWHV
ncbi:mitogen-activated protein kinase [Cladophialophora chaetospira]|uniref:cyclin-dependent kinase n=1 Tax=Cladophialophora chaetospira TaxID=386627 RepID=A0AA38XJB5_9EURO|nr:mitogen-activated protein kinase [Cladophialophora chaetospira]